MTDCRSMTFLRIMRARGTEEPFELVVAIVQSVRKMGCGAGGLTRDQGSLFENGHGKTFLAQHVGCSQSGYARPNDTHVDTQIFVERGRVGQGRVACPNGNSAHYWSRPPS